MMINLPLLDEADVKGKRVLVRGDVDVPLKDGQIADDSRLQAIKPTIDYLVQSGAEVILCGHIGRPASADAAARQALSTKPIQEWVSRSVGQKVRVLENLRFDPREETNDESLAKELAAQADVFVNEAFAACERAHASIVGVPKLLPHFAGFRLAEEVRVLSKVLENPERPLVVFIGGIKWETKDAFAKKMEAIADTVVTSKMLSTIENGKDVTTGSVDQYADQIAGAATIIWNGPFGQIEDFTYQVGTRRLAELITANEMAYKVVGGGDTVAFINKLGLADKFNWVSVGGGSMLKFLSGEGLPGIEALLK